MYDTKTIKTKTTGVSPTKPAALTITLRDCPIKYRMAREAFEAEFLRAKLDKYAGNVSRTARSLGVSRKTLALKIQRYGIDLRVLRGITSESYQEISVPTRGTSTTLERVAEELV